MKVTFEAEVYEYNFGNGDMHLERSPYTSEEFGMLETTVDVCLPIPEFKTATFTKGKRFRITVEEVPE